MDDIQAAVFERMRQAVGRLVRDGAALDGQVVLTIRDGKLVSVELPEKQDVQNKPSEVVTYGMVDGQSVGGYEPAEDAKAVQELPAVLQVGKQKFSRMKRADD